MILWCDCCLDVTSAELSLPDEVPVIPEVTDGRTCSPVNSVTGAYEEVEDQGAVSSDDEELDKLAREDLIRDMLANNGNYNQIYYGVLR